MARINLRDLYPHYKGDSFVEISDEVLKEIEACKRKEKAYIRYMRYHNVALTLDSDSERKAEVGIIDGSIIPHEAYEQKTMHMLLHAALKQLPDNQAKRIYAYFFLGLTFADIAKSEGVQESAVRGSVERGLRRLKKYFEKIL